jgi:hypothetical protein
METNSNSDAAGKNQIKGKIMKKLILSICSFLLFCSPTPKPVEGSLNLGNLNGKMKLVDMGYVDGEVQGKKLHCYYVVYGNDLGNSYDHIYVLEDGVISVNRGLKYNPTTTITAIDTFKLD